MSNVVNRITNVNNIEMSTRTSVQAARPGIETNVSNAGGNTSGNSGGNTSGNSGGNTSSKKKPTSYTIDVDREESLSVSDRWR